MAPLKSAPVNSGPKALPADAADKWTPSAKAFLSGYFELSTANAGGCQRFAPPPRIINAKNPSIIQFELERKETSKKPKESIIALKPIMIPALFLNTSAITPAGTFTNPAEILFADARVPIWTPERDKLSFMNGSNTWTEDEKTCFRPCPKDNKYNRELALRYSLLSANLINIILAISLWAH